MCTRFCVNPLYTVLQKGPHFHIAQALMLAAAADNGPGCEALLGGAATLVSFAYVSDFRQALVQCSNPVGYKRCRFCVIHRLGCGTLLHVFDRSCVIVVPYRSWQMRWGEQL